MAVSRIGTMEYINKLSIQIDQKQLLEDVEHILGLTPLWPNQQISLTSITGDDDWDCSIGKIADLNYKEHEFTTINNSIKDRYIGSLIESLAPNYCRWRIMNKARRTCYSVHHDGTDHVMRLHIPVITNDQNFLMFYTDQPNASDTGTDISIKHYNLETGSAYLMRTNYLHSAVNFSNEDRIHIVATQC